jgi:hypothetical protein
VGELVERAAGARDLTADDPDEVTALVVGALTGISLAAQATGAVEALPSAGGTIPAPPAACADRTGTRATLPAVRGAAAAAVTGNPDRVARWCSRSSTPKP